ncbi:FAD binding domain-containing protein [Paraburkholderia sp. RL17-337-BIB-A]|uniref:FAD binding domain-containing protein n=1 Tax=Paraburkholderia sp. RL17-337-BIB-A TaxID=3031636 RepID=UPI0038BB2E7B
MARPDPRCQHCLDHHRLKARIMNLNTITTVKRPANADEVGWWEAGDAWLAGGTYLFSEPQLTTHTLIDIEQFGWPALQVTPNGLEIAATCRIMEIYRLESPAEWVAGPLLRECCDALLASFKIWNAATVGGNICLSLPAGAMISLVTALEGTLTLWPRNGTARTVSALDFVTGNHQNILHAGELLRSIHLPATALARRYALRRASLVKLGRSAALLIGTRGSDGDLLITITASTPRPVQLAFADIPTPDELRRAIASAIPDDDYFDDVNGLPEYRRHLTYYFAEQIRAELAQSGGKA